MTDFGSARARRSAEPVTTWPFLVAAAVILLVLVVLTGDPGKLLKAGVDLGDAAAVGGFVAGGAVLGGILQALVVWLLLYFLFVRSRDPSAGGWHLGVLIAIGIAAHMLIELTPEFGRAAQDPHQDALARQGVSQSIKQLRSGGAIDARPLSSGEDGVMEGFVRSSLGKSQALHASYVADLKAAGLDQIFSEASLKADPTLAKTEAKLRTIDGIVQTYRDRTTALEDQLMSEARKLPVSAANRRGILEGMEKTRADNAAALERQWNSETAIVGAYRNAVLALKSSRGHWAFVKGKLTFDDPSALTLFRSRVDRIQTLSRQEIADMNQQMDRAEQTFAQPPPPTNP